MVVVETSGSMEARFRLLEALRQYATEKLEESGELTGMRERHAKYFLAIAEQADRELHGAGQIPWVKRLDREHDNLRRALSHWETRGDLESGARLAGSLWRYWWFFGHQREGRHRLDRILEPLGRPALLDRTEPRRIQAPTWAFALHAAGVLDLMTDDFVRAREHLSDAIGLWRKLGYKRATAESLHWLFAASFFLGDHVNGRTLILESLALSRKLGDEWNLAEALPWLGWLNLTEGSLQAARAAYTEAVLLARKVRDQAHLGWALAFFGFVALAEGNAREAREIFTEGRDFSSRSAIVTFSRTRSQVSAFSTRTTRDSPRRTVSWPRPSRSWRRSAIRPAFCWFWSFTCPWRRRNRTGIEPCALAEPRPPSAEDGTAVSPWVLRAGSRMRSSEPAQRSVMRSRPPHGTRASR